MSRRAWLIGGGAALVVVLGAVGIWLWQSSAPPASAEDAAAAYLHALESGDPDAVDATGIDVTPEALTAFDDATALIADAAVASTDQTADAATVGVSFTLDGEKREAELSLSRADGVWTVDASALGNLTATPSLGDFVTIGAATFPASAEIALLPAMYAVTPAPSDLLDGGGDIVVLPGEGTALTIDATLRPEATEAAQQQLDEHLEACAASEDIAPVGCGIRIPWGTEFSALSGASYRIEKLPAIALTASGFTADGGVIVATVTGTGQDGAARTTTYRSESWAVRGDVTFTDRRLVLETW